MSVFRKRRGVVAAIAAAAATIGVALPAIPTATASTLQPIVPIMECVIPDADGVGFTSYWSYENQNSTPFTIPVSANNKFTPSPDNRGQPTVFQPGRVTTLGWWNAPLVVRSEKNVNLIWRIASTPNLKEGAVANYDSHVCGFEDQLVLSGAVAPDAYVLSWPELESAVSYRLFRDGTLVYQGADANFLDTNLAPFGTPVTFQVRAVAANGQLSVPSNTVTLTRWPAPPVPAAIGGELRVNLTWAPVPLAVSYDVERDGTVIATGVIATSYADLGLVPGAYTYRVRAVFPTGTGDWSADTVGTSVDMPAPVVVAVTSGDQVDLSWAPLASAVSYDVERDGTVIATGVTATSYADLGLAPGAYTYRVRGVATVQTGSWNGPWSAPVAATIEVQLAAPIVTAAAGSQPGDVDVVWTALTGAAGYEVELEGVGQVAQVAAPQTSVVDQQAPGGTYRYRVRGVTPSGVPGPWSEWAEVTLAPATPDLAVVAAVGGVTANDSMYIGKLRDPLGPMAAGDSRQRAIRFTSLANVPFSLVGVQISASPRNALVTDTVNGLQLRVERCGSQWQETRVGSVSTFSCAGATSVVYDGPISPSNGFLVNFGPASPALQPGGIDDLRFTIYLPVTAPNTMQSLSTTINWTFGGVRDTSIRAVVTWSATAGATSYDLERTAPAGSPTIVYQGTATRYYDNQMPVTGVYTYRVRAVNPGGPSPWSAPVAFTRT